MQLNHSAVANVNVGRRCRPWYSFEATEPKDIIIMIDKSSSMLEAYLTSGQTKLSVATQAAQSAIVSLNPTDNVSRQVAQLCVEKPRNSNFTSITKLFLEALYRYCKRFDFRALKSIILGAR